MHNSRGNPIAFAFQADQEWESRFRDGCNLQRFGKSIANSKEKKRWRKQNPWYTKARLSACPKRKSLQLALKETSGSILWSRTPKLLVTERQASSSNWQSECPFAWQRARMTTPKHPVCPQEKNNQFLMPNLRTNGIFKRETSLHLTLHNYMKPLSHWILFSTNFSRIQLNQGQFKGNRWPTYVAWAKFNSASVEIGSGKK